MYLVLEGSVVLRSQLPTSGFDPQGHARPPAKGAGEGGGGSSLVRVAVKGEWLAGKGDVFGEAGLFPEELGPHRRESATTLSRITAYVLDEAALQDIANEYPEVWLISHQNSKPGQQWRSRLGCAAGAIQCHAIG
jgi:CRP-like cAMP-binding protein